MISANNLLLIFIPVALILRVMPKNLRKWVLLAASFVFYLLCDYRYFALVIVEVFISFVIAHRISPGKKKWLIIGIIWELIFLCFFKYYHFFADGIDGAWKIIMPLGISYYTFKILSYQIDIYRGKIETTVGMTEYINYVMFFPQIVCGPIGRAPQLLEQFKNWEIENDLSDGIMLIISGMFKKYVIADRLVDYVGCIFDNYVSYPTLALWMAGFFYTIEIYCDFAGYSEIAVGIAKLMGIETENNFNLPYFSYSIKEFWRRWHISLSSWLKDYIYISAGGSRCSKLRQKFNLLLTFFVSGLWHGNGFNFVVWGLYHGVIDLIPVKESKRTFVRVLQCILTFVIVMFGWIMFRANGLMDGFKYIGLMFNGISTGMMSYENIVASVMPFTFDYSCVAYLLTVLIMIILLFALELREHLKCKRNDMVRIAVYVSCLILFGIVGSNSFLYANF